MKTTLDIPQEFYKAEERGGYPVSEKIKKVWAVQLDLLSELKRVCGKYGLQYYAEAGTLIGAIRHRGFIPWDDDIDLAMKREDYDKLLQIGAEEFKDPYFLQNSHSETYPRGFTRLRNSDTTALTKGDFGENVNYGIFIDIFPMDNLPDNLLIRKVWLTYIKFLRVLLLAVYPKRRENYKGFFRSAVYYAERGLGCVCKYADVVNRFDKACSKYNRTDTQKISYVSFSFANKKHIWDRSAFDSSHPVPFEFTDINIPDGYDAKLRVQYGDYMKPVHAPTVHGGMIFEAEIPYKQYLQEHSAQEIKRTLEAANLEK